MLTVSLLATYTVLPLVLYLGFDAGPHFAELAALSGLSAACVWLGSRLPLLDAMSLGRTTHISIPSVESTAVLWTTFVSFVVVAWFTAERIPLVAAIGGADPETLAVLRERFLKDRQGWQASFVYINAVLSGALVPYSLAMMFLKRARGRWLAFSFFVVFCVSFVEKTYFFKAALPLLYLVAQRRVRVPFSPGALIAVMCGLLVLVTILAGSGTADTELASEAFFSTAYAPQGALAHLLWRSVAIPLLTAADAIRVLNDEFDGRVLWGATSSLLAGISGMDRIEFERLVFAAQWGQNETGTGSANSVFVTEAYVNFGWVGVAVFSMLVGLMMRVFCCSRDEAFRSLWIVFAMGVYTSGLIGLLFSNGFVLLFVIALLMRFETALSRPLLNRAR